jgi:hypothetical protein
MVAALVGRSTGVLPLGVFVAIAATAPVTVTIAMEGPSGDAIYARNARCETKVRRPKCHCHSLPDFGLKCGAIPDWT